MFLSSDTDTDSEWDSDSSDLPNGPMKQALEVNLKDKNKYDFSTNYPETGDQFLLAVRKERKQIPKYTSADMSKIQEIKNRKLAKLEKENPSSPNANTSTSDQQTEGGEAHSSNKSSNNQQDEEAPSTSKASPENEASSSSPKESPQKEDTITKELVPGIEKLNIEENKLVEESVQTDNLKNNLEIKEVTPYRFLPTDLWRHDRISQFTYMRDKIDNVRTLMQDGQFILVSRFDKSHMRDRTHWLRYCFGFQEAQRMIDTKRSSKLAAKAAYDASRKPKPVSSDENDNKSLTSGDEEDEVSDENSDLEFVSKDEVKSLELIHQMGVITVDDSDDLMKLSGGSLEELVIIPPQEERSESVEPELQQQMLQSINSDSTTGEDDLKEENPKSRPDVTLPTEQSPMKEQTADDKTYGEISAIPIDDLSLQNVALQQQLRFDDACASASTETGTDDSSIFVDVLKDRNAEDEAAKREAHLNLYGRDPTVHLLLSMPTHLIEFLLTLNLEWVKEFGFMNRRQGSWLYSLMTFVPEPVDPSIVSDLRAAVPALVKCRDKAIQEIELSITNSPDPFLHHEVNAVTSSDTSTATASSSTGNIGDQAKESDSNFDASDILSSCNLFIALIIDFFGQKDLNRLICSDDFDRY